MRNSCAKSATPASTSSQNLDRQIAALRAAECDLIFREKASGKDTKGRPQLERAIDELGTGDVLVVAEGDRATRSMLDGVAIIVRIHARGCFVKVSSDPQIVAVGYLFWWFSISELPCSHQTGRLGSAFCRRCVMGNLVTSRRERRMKFWPVAEGKGRDGRRVNHSDVRQAEEALEVIARLPTAARERKS